MITLPLPLILGSSSKSRHSILNSHQVPFTSIKPCIDEKGVAPQLRSQPSEYTFAVANAKMNALLEGYKKELENVLLVTCDQVVSWKGQVREKPSCVEVLLFFVS